MNFKLAIVRLFKNKIFFIINLLGISVATVACIFIGSFIVTELGYDSFHTNSHHIYRVEHNDYRDGGIVKSTSTVSALGPEIASFVPEVNSFCRIHPASGLVIVEKDGLESPFLEKVYYVDSTMWSIFSFPLHHGNPNAIFGAANTAAISESAAKKYFGDTNAIGKSLIFDGKTGGKSEFIVEAIFRDVPFNSHLQFDVLFSYASMGQKMDTNWDWEEDYTYLLLHPDANPNLVENKLLEIVKKFHVKGSEDTYSLISLKDIHLNSKGNNEIGKTIDISVIKLFAIICSFILIIAIINYTNSSIAKALRQAREIGIQKIFGATKKNLLSQFLAESLVFNLFGFSLSVILIIALFPVFSRISNVPRSVFVLNWPLWILVGLIFIASILLCSFFPAYVVAQFKSLEAVSGKLVKSSKGIWFRKLLMGAQLVITFVLLGSTLLVYYQIHFLKKQDIGLTTNNIVVIQEPIVINSKTADKFEPFKTELLRNASIQNVTHSSAVPGQPITWERADIKFRNIESEQQYSIKIMAVDYNFFEFYDLKILSGRSFSQESESNNKSIIISRAAAKRFGFDDLHKLLGEFIFIGERRLEIIGIVEDYHHLYFKYSIEPQIYMLAYPNKPIYSIQILNTSMGETIATIKKNWLATYPRNFFEFFFLDDYYNNQYVNEDKLYELVSLFSILAMLLSVLGLWSFTLYCNTQRLKEIAVRKVLGSSAFNIITLLLKEYILIAAISILAGCPLIYFFANEWLSYYAIRIPLTIELFVIPGSFLLVLTTITISTHSYKAASSGPTKYLKSE